MERRISVDTRHGGDRGQIRSTRRFGVRLGFPVFLLEGIHALSLLYFSAFGHGVSRSWILSSWALETVKMGFWWRWSFSFWSS